MWGNSFNSNKSRRETAQIILDLNRLGMPMRQIGPEAKYSAAREKTANHFG